MLRTIGRFSMREKHPNQSMHLPSISPALEFCAWASVFLAPMLRLVNGPPVTDDQKIIQAITFGFSLIVALVLRMYNWKTARSG